MIKNDVLVELPGYTFWFSDFKSLAPDFKYVNYKYTSSIMLRLNDLSYIGFEPKNNETLEQLFEKCNKIIVAAEAEYRKRNLEYAIAMDNGGVLDSNGMSIAEQILVAKGDKAYFSHLDSQMPITEIPKSGDGEIKVALSDQVIKALKLPGWKELKESQTDKDLPYKFKEGQIVKNEKSGHIFKIETLSRRYNRYMKWINTYGEKVIISCITDNAYYSYHDEDTLVLAKEKEVPIYDSSYNLVYVKGNYE